MKKSGTTPKRLFCENKKDAYFLSGYGEPRLAPAEKSISFLKDSFC
ncbi:hypothetical protein JTF06_09840 [Desemzia sp. RIT804]|nr:hypothetical protein [Desemzia sp. RIT 804]MBM6615188.1 hypothetical protein [Desemzia sp. RIT 804]